jgi:2-keto-4-pentenoate hydratase
MDDVFRRAADALDAAYRTRSWCSPVRTEIGSTVEAGYRVQEINTARWLAKGRVIAGRKIGLTSVAVQRQLGVDQPDFGVLFSDMRFASGEPMTWTRLQQPKAEAEVALVLARDMTAESPTHADVVAATAYVAPAIEVVGSRIDKWDISIADTVADNASSGLYVLGEPVSDFRALDLAACEMVMTKGGQAVSTGSGAACLGNPLNAAVWLARKLAGLGAPLRAGDVVLTGALGPMVAVAPGDVFEARIGSIGTVCAHFAGADA